MQQHYDYHHNPLPPPGGGFTGWVVASVAFVTVTWFVVSIIGWIIGR